MNTNNTPLNRPKMITLATVLLAAQLIGAVVIVLWYFQQTFGGEFFDLASTMFQILLAVAAVVWIGAAAVGIYLGKSIARALAAVMQIIMIALGVSFLQSGSEGTLTIVAIVMLGLGVGILFCLFTKSATAWLSGDAERE